MGIMHVNCDLISAGCCLYWQDTHAPMDPRTDGVLSLLLYTIYCIGIPSGIQGIRGTPPASLRKRQYHVNCGHGNYPRSKANPLGSDILKWTKLSARLAAARVVMSLYAQESVMCRDSHILKLEYPSKHQV